MVSSITGLRSIFKTIVQFLSLANEKKLQQMLSQFVAASLFHSGGVGGIRTLAPVTRPNDLANRPLQPLEYHSIMAERVGFEPTHPFEPTGFQDRTLQPLEYLSVINSNIIAGYP